MPAVLVHGVPDTAKMWDPLLAVLTRDDIVALRLPGFGEAVPEGFASTKEEYVDWIVEQLGSIESASNGPIDLVGHDWGSLLVQRVALTRPELLRSYTLSNGAITDRFKWHDLAVQWQTPEVGEEIMATLTPEAMAPGLAGAGHPSAETAAAAMDDTMKRCILALYRSATDLPGDWAPTGAVALPGLVVWGKDDPVDPPASGQRFAEVTGARIVLLDGGHWAAVEHPQQSATAMEDFWASLG
jgi:pimeloyl-ACP methyl ester carboxylesterase